MQSLHDGRPSACEISINRQTPAGDDPGPRPVHRYEERGVDRCDGIAVYLQSPFSENAERTRELRISLRSGGEIRDLNHRDATRQQSSFRMNDRWHGRGYKRSAQEIYPTPRSVVWTAAQQTVEFCWRARRKTRRNRA